MWCVQAYSAAPLLVYPTQYTGEPGYIKVQLPADPAAAAALNAADLSQTNTHAEL